MTVKLDVMKIKPVINFKLNNCYITVGVLFFTNVLGTI